jgi:hypothetical protein
MSPESRNFVSLAISSAAEYPSIRRCCSWIFVAISRSCSVIFGRAIT